MTEYKIHIADPDGILLDTIYIDTTERFWDSANTKQTIGAEIFDEIYRDLTRREENDSHD